jgi:cytoskeletal protein RodZ
MVQGQPGQTLGLPIQDNIVRPQQSKKKKKKERKKEREKKKKKRTLLSLLLLLLLLLGGGETESHFVAQGWPQMVILLISASQVARITGVSHRSWPY